MLFTLLYSHVLLNVFLSLIRCMFLLIYHIHLPSLCLNFFLYPKKKGLCLNSYATRSVNSDLQDEACNFLVIKIGKGIFKSLTHPLPTNC